MLFNLFLLGKWRTFFPNILFPLKKLISKISWCKPTYFGRKIIMKSHLNFGRISIWYNFRDFSLSEIFFLLFSFSLPEIVRSLID